MQFVSVISSARATDKLSISPSDCYGEFNILKGKEVIACIYYDTIDGGTYIEKAYQGIYEIEMEEIKGLIRNIK